MKKMFIDGARGGIMAGMLFVGSNVAFADTIAEYSYPAYTSKTINGMHMMHRWNSKTKINLLASQLGLNNKSVKEKLKSGKNLKQILQEHGIVPGQLQKAFKSKEDNK